MRRGLSRRLRSDNFPSCCERTLAAVTGPRRLHPHGKAHGGLGSPPLPAGPVLSQDPIEDPARPLAARSPRDPAAGTVARPLSVPGDRPESGRRSPLSRSDCVVGLRGRPRRGRPARATVLSPCRGHVDADPEHLAGVDAARLLHHGAAPPKSTPQPRLPRGGGWQVTYSLGRGFQERLWDHL